MESAKNPWSNVSCSSCAMRVRSSATPETGRNDAGESLPDASIKTEEQPPVKRIESSLRTIARTERPFSVRPNVLRILGLLLGVDPLPDVSWTVFQLYRFPFAAGQESHPIAIDQRDVTEIERDVLVRRFQAQEPPQLGDVSTFDSTAQ